MEIVPWRPFGGELSALGREMDSLWNRFSGETPFTEERLPSVDISETKDGFIIKADLSGMDAKDIDVNISGGLLTIKGEKKKEDEEKDEHHYYAERHCGTFQRTIELPTSVHSDKVEATFNKGILKITLPKAEEAKKREVRIKVE